VYRHKATGIVFPISIGGFDQQDMTTLDFETVNQNAKLKQRHFEAFRDLFTYIALFDAETFERDLAQLRAVLEASRKPFVVIDLFDDIAKIDRPNYRKKAVLNARVRKALDGLPNVHHLSFSQCVLDRSEEIHLNHFSRSCYLRLAEKAKAQIALLEGAAV
jgi:hypothetical protein